MWPVWPDSILVEPAISPGLPDRHDVLMDYSGSEVNKSEVPEVGGNWWSLTVMPGRPSACFETKNRGVKRKERFPRPETLARPRNSVGAGREGEHLRAEFLAWYRGKERV
jgi:hypothetical protein